MFLEWENNSGKLRIISGKFQNDAIDDVKQISLSHVISRRTTMPKCEATLLKSHFGMVFSCKFAAYFQNIFSQEHLYVAASD